MKKQLKVLIIGGGIAGCASAHLLSQLDNTDILLVENNSMLGAGVRTYWQGGHPHTFGPRYFLTKKMEVYEYFNKIIPLRTTNENEFLSYSEQDNQFYNYPLHYDDIARMPDKKKIYKELENRKTEFKPTNLKDYWINSIGLTLYNKFMDKYNKKMWQVDDPSEIDTFAWSPKGATLKNKDESKAAWDGAINAYPYAKDGYNQYFDIATKDTKVLLNSKVKVKNIKEKIFIINEKEEIKFDIVISTASPDDILDHSFGQLPYIGRDMHNIVMPVEHVLPKNIFFLYFPNNEKFTRIAEYKKFTHHKAENSLIGLEFPSSNGRHYPLPQKKWHRLAKQYIDEFPEGMYSIGRNGSYFYSLDIDDCISQAMEIKSDILNNQISSGVAGEDYKFDNRI
tara:strand:+ start:9673 stop:10857 length:1185 start_codon:yes stop_codon:yes gene_type:complete